MSYFVYQYSTSQISYWSLLVHYENSPSSCKTMPKTILLRSSEHWADVRINMQNLMFYLVGLLLLIPIVKFENTFRGHVWWTRNDSLRVNKVVPNSGSTSSSDLVARILIFFSEILMKRKRRYVRLRRTILHDYTRHVCEASNKDVKLEGMLKKKRQYLGMCPVLEGVGATSHQMAGANRENDLNRSRQAWHWIAVTMCFTVGCTQHFKAWCL